MYSDLQRPNENRSRPSLVKRGASRAIIMRAWKNHLATFPRKQDQFQLYFKLLMVLRVLLLVKAEVPKITLL